MTGKKQFLKYCFFFCVLFLYAFFIPGTACAQDDNDDEGDEITVAVNIKEIGDFEMPAIIRGNHVSLPINNLFDIFKVKAVFTHNFDSLSGFYINQKDIYVIDKMHNTITLKDTVTNLKPVELIKEDNNLYVDLKYLKSIFRIDGEFSFRKLEVDLRPEVELPATIEARQELMRKNVSKLKGDAYADTTIKRTYPLVHFGTADWAVTSEQGSTGGTETKMSLGLGGVLAGGDVNASLNYYPGYKLINNEQYYLWRYVNNDNPIMRQVSAGTIFAQSIASLYSPVVGIQFTNAPTTYRKSYGTYTISNTTDPGWIVELYVNDVLVDYKKTDESGFYTFDVPLIYGYSIIKLKFFGPYGEQRTTQTYINIPFNFIPIHEVEYTASAGIVEDGLNSLFSLESVKYGLSNSITIGAGMEYLSSITGAKTIPFGNASVKLAKNLLLSCEYDYGVKTSAVLTFRLPSNIQLDLDYTNYAPGQTAIIFNYQEEKKAVLSIPYHHKLFSIFSRFTADQITVPNASYTDLEWSLTSSYKNLNFNVGNYAAIVQQTTPYLYGLYSVSTRILKKSTVSVQLQYDYKQGKPIFTKYTFERRIMKNGYFNLALQQFFNQSSNIEQSQGNYADVLVGLRYDFSVTKIAMTALVDNNKGYSFVQSATGSFMYDHKTDYFNANNRVNVGKAEIAIVPFLDINCNGKRDPGEPLVPGIKIQMNGGRIVENAKDTVIRIFDLEAYRNYYVTLNTLGLDNISWQIKKHILKVAVIPNDFTNIEVPVEVVGEASGSVSVTDRQGRMIRGAKQMIVNILDSAMQTVAHLVSESDGYFDFIGLPPGSYYAQLDSLQLHNLQLQTASRRIPFHIRQMRDGDVVDALEFKIVSVNDTAGKAQLITALNKIDTAAGPKNKRQTTESVSDTMVPDESLGTNSKAIAKTYQKAHHHRLRDTTRVAGANVVHNYFPQQQYQLPTARFYGQGRDIYYDSLAYYIDEFRPGTSICVFNDRWNIIDIQRTSPKGYFYYRDFIGYKMNPPDKTTGILSQVVFLNDDMEIIETVNKRRNDSTLIFVPNKTDNFGPHSDVHIYKIRDKE